MFKTIKKIAVLSSLFVLSWSCVVNDYVYIPRSSSSLASFADNLVEYSSENSVRLLIQIASSEETMNEDGFTYELEYNKSLTYNVVWVSDNCWEVTGIGTKNNFTLQVRRESSDNLDDEYKWIVTSLSLNRDEFNGYTAFMTSDGDIVYDWYESTYTTSLSKRWDLLQTGTYYMQTYISGVEADSCALSYNAGKYTVDANMVSTGSGFPN